MNAKINVKVLPSNSKRLPNHKIFPHEKDYMICYISMSLCVSPPTRLNYVHEILIQV